MADLETVIAGALEEARTSGALPNEGTETVVPDTPDENTPVEESETPEEAPEGEEKPAEGGDPDPKVEEGSKTEKKPAAEEKPKKDDTPADKSDEEDEHKAVVGKDNRIPYKESRRIADNREKKAFAKVAEALGLSEHTDWKKLTPDTFVSAISTLSGELKTLRDDAVSYKSAGEIMLSDPDEFIRRAVHVNPDFANFVRKDAKTTTPPASGDPAAPDTDDPEPEPDAEIDLPDGKKGKTYSAEGFKKLRAWDRKQGEKAALAKIDARLSPIEKERKAKEDAERDRKDLANYIDIVVARASKRRGWKEHESAIQTAINSDPKYKGMTFVDAIDAAYDDIVTGKLMRDIDDVRAKLEKIGTGAPASTSISSDAGKKKVEEVEGAEDGDDSATLAIRKAVAAAKRAGLK